MTHSLTCDEAQDVLVYHSSGVECAAGAVQSLEQHLEGCPDCRDFVAVLEEVERWTATAAAEELEAVDPVAYAALMDKIRAAVDARDAEMRAKEARRLARSQGRTDIARELTCTEAESLGIDRLWIELEPDELQALDQHLETCAACRRFQQQVRELDEQLAAYFRSERGIARTIAAVEAFARGERKLGGSARAGRSLSDLRRLA